MSAKLFGEYLNQGSKGDAVLVLQLWLKTKWPTQSHDLVVDGDYGAITAAVVSGLQHTLDLEIDGHFGPRTRAAIKERYDIDFDAIPATIGETKAVGP